MNILAKKVAALIDVKTFITVVVMAVWAACVVVSLRVPEVEIPQEVHYLCTAVVGFFIGSKTSEKKTTDAESEENDG
ncbi:MAG: hypothetical protein LBT21_06345 [Oscillospiraceae bacterium]|jgi:uncharacterized membrane protein AbrB (regulator of aidB expression)|nr:hypothetical protein [Oscillospiraceae bacterium]